MATQELNEQELNISYAGEFVKTWLDGAKNPETPDQVKQHLQEVIDGVSFYRAKYLAVQDDYTSLLEKYNQLTSLSANYLEVIRQLRESNDGLLVESQRDFHHKEGE